MARKKGKFIVVEGGEGAGKGTHLRALEALVDKNTVVFTREPGGTPLAEAIRKLIFSEVAKNANAVVVLLLMFAARFDHMIEKIFLAIRAGKNVVSDRYYPSTYAYQVNGQGAKYLLKLFQWLCKLLDKQVKPHLIIYLDVDPVIGLERVKGRADGNFFDEKALEFHQTVRRAMKAYMLSQAPCRVCIIDSNRPLEVVQEEFLREMQQALE